MYDLTRPVHGNNNKEFNEKECRLRLNDFDSGGGYFERI